MTRRQKFRALYMSVGFIATYFLFGALFSIFKGVVPDAFERYAQGVAGTAGAVIAVVVFTRLEHKSWREFGLNWERGTMGRFLFGTLLGCFIAFVMMYSQVLYSNLVLIPNDEVTWLPFLLWNLAFIPLAFMEEVAFRSYPLIQLNRTFGLRYSQLILAILFAVYHMLMGWSISSSLLGPGIWSLAYVLTAVASRGIAVPTGLHFGLNFIQSIIGGQKGIAPFYFLDYPEGVTEKAIQANESYGYTIQIAALILLILATEWYIRRRRKDRSNVYGVG